MLPHSLCLMLVADVCKDHAVIPTPNLVDYAQVSSGLGLCEGTYDCFSNASALKPPNDDLNYLQDKHMSKPA
jgi:hypothetical protein